MTARTDLPPLVATAEPRRPRRGQTVFLAFAVLFLIPAVGAAVLRLLPPTQDDGALIASFIPYGMVGTVLALLCFVITLLRARRRTALGLCSLVVAALLGLQASWLAPLFTADTTTMTTTPITMISLNTKAGQVDQSALEARSATADIVVLVEVTPDLMRELLAGPMGRRFPYVVPDEHTEFSVSAIFSRFPIISSQALPRTSWQMYSARIDVPQLGALNVVGAHPCNPLCGGDRWESEHQVLQQYLDALPSGPTVVAGDFNATDDHLPMRQLVADGYRSATDVAGAGWLPTFPSNSTLPPLIPIDHILINSGLTASSVTSFRIAGSDHRGLEAVIGGVR